MGFRITPGYGVGYDTEYGFDSWKQIEVGAFYKENKKIVGPVSESNSFCVSNAFSLYVR